MKDAPAAAELRELFDNTRQTLLDLRGAHGHWEGELSSSALSTATAVVALGLYLQASADAEHAARLPALITAGLDWLASTQNVDGGWGDTVLSKSNISTTALVWAAFFGREDRYDRICQRCETWLKQAAGGLEPRLLTKAIVERYGRDRTFSVPILTTLALRNRLGQSADAWRLVPQLPFELAAFPSRWYARLKLPVVSYALPALIAIGQVKHFQAPTRNPLSRLFRNATRARTLRVLTSIQPTSGGFLEATPLTSFVVLSLVGAGNASHPVVRQGIEFLIRSARDDGSWPIDTNLATWVTTLAVNALSTAGEIDASLSREESGRIFDWLSSQQYRQVHPYTNAAPGGWAWTDLSGGVPDADDTPGALLALWHLAGPAASQNAEAGVTWLLDLQNSDGGIPTFCRGWGLFPFDRSSADLTAHVLRAWSVWYDHLPKLQHRIENAAARGWQFLARTQQSNGAWAPLWFGNQHLATEENLTYGTSRVIVALATAAERIMSPRSSRPRFLGAVAWLGANQNPDGGWGGGLGTPSSIEETALAVEALCAVLQSRPAVMEEILRAPRMEVELRRSISRGLRCLIDQTGCGREFPPSPIGFYFAKLWYYEKLYPIVYVLAAAGLAWKLTER